MSTESTTNVMIAIRKQILESEPVDGVALLETLGGNINDARFWFVQAPDDADLPYVVARLINAQNTGNSMRVRADLEVMVFARPRSFQQVAETIADRIQGALLGWVSDEMGLIFSNECSARDSLAPAEDPGDRELVMVRLLFEVVYYPMFLSKYGVPSSRGRA